MARKGRNGPPGQIPSLPARTSSEIKDDNANATPIEPTLAASLNGKSLPPAESLNVKSLPSAERVASKKAKPAARMVSKKVKPTVRVASKKGQWAGSSTSNQAKPAARPVFQC